MDDGQRRRELGHSKEFDLKKGENATALVQSQGGVTLLGGGPVVPGDLADCLEIAPVLVAADSGANTAVASGHMPDAVIGDMDSLDPKTAARIPAERLHLVAEQNSTDFDKALRHVSAPFVLALGVTGARIDHELAVYHSLVAHPARPCIVVGSEDIVCHISGALELSLPVGTRVSLFPMAAVHGRSEGLRWPIEGLAFHPATKIGTSNETVAERVHLSFDQPGMLLVVPRAHLRALITAFQDRADI